MTQPLLREDMQAAFMEAGMMVQWIDNDADAIIGRPASTAMPEKFGWECNMMLMTEPKLHGDTPRWRTPNEVIAKFKKHNWVPVEFTIHSDVLYWNPA